VQSDEERIRMRARQLAAEGIAAGDSTGWFERLYSEAEAGVSVVPWADGEANPHLVEWATSSGLTGADLTSAGLTDTGRRALVVGCGLGYDAEYLAGLGFEVTAFDVAPTAIVAAKRAHPDSAVSYETADLLELPSSWAGAFDLVVEIYTVQPLYGPVRERALAALHQPVAPGGTLLVIARATNEEDPERDPDQMPWALTRAELSAAAGGVLRAVRIEQFAEEELPPPHLRWRAEFRRP
jgi:2-polyprenyl-3-methyl-5-hydroxy-6-metoxy-1,4-benzoquinol methylase